MVSCRYVSNKTTMKITQFVVLLLISLGVSVGGYAEDTTNSKFDQKFDRRLLGKWQSDREKTLEWIRENRKFTKERIEKLDKAVKFGTMVVEIKENSTSYTYNGETSVEPSEVLGFACNTVAVVTKNPFNGEDEIRLITIESDDLYSVYTDWVDIREYFKKIK